MRWMLLRFQEQPDEQIMQQIQQQAIEDLIEERVQLHEFKKLVKDKAITPAEIDESISDLARGYKLTREQFLTALAEAGIPQQSIRDMEEAKTAPDRADPRPLLQDRAVSELRIDEMLQRLEAGLHKPQYRLFEIFLYARTRPRASTPRPAPKR